MEPIMQNVLASPRVTPRALKERAFYADYAWCLNPFPTLAQTIEHLRLEADRLDKPEPSWCQDEVAINVYLLACAVSNSFDDYLAADRYDLARVANFSPRIGGPIVKAFRVLESPCRLLRSLRLHRLHSWRNAWEQGVNGFLRAFLSKGQMTVAGQRLTSLLEMDFPATLLSRRLKVPAAFRSQDLTHVDVLALGEKFVTGHRKPNRPLLILGVRTAGSYFAPLLRAYLEEKGYADVDTVTIRPKKEPAAHEKAKMVLCAAGNGVALVIDEPINTGDTLAKGCMTLRTAGFSEDRIVALFPVHPSRRDWSSDGGAGQLQRVQVITLQPEEWHKSVLLESTAAEQTIRDYLATGSSRIVHVAHSASAKQLNSDLESISDKKFHNRLKRVYEVQLENGSGSTDTRYVFAKSVGWGWLSYHAFIAGERLAPFVPPVLGLRQGILYTEWDRRSPIAAGSETDRNSVLAIAPRYVAARARSLSLPSDPTPELAQQRQHHASEELVDMLAKAHRSRIASRLKRRRLLGEISRQGCPVPAFIDSKMRPLEWITAKSGPRKSDFEHHGMGKTTLNVTDPVYDLAEMILYWKLSPSEERRLIESYKKESGDVTVERRLFRNKLLAGRESMRQEIANLNDPRLLDRRQQSSQQYVDALNFLTLQTARFCAALCLPPEATDWKSPLLVLDVDGVLDKQIFGFPSTTAAGIEAVSLLHAHGFPVVLNTARSARELKEYCEAYRFLGGVAEYGAFVWEACTGKERALISDEALGQLKRVRSHLRLIPGVFVNENYEYSLKAFAYERGVTVPLPTTMIRDLIASCGADLLAVHQTYTDTTLTAKETDKGRGLRELLAMTGNAPLETIAVGDTEADLPMFRAATRCFAPSNLNCLSAAKSLGCEIATQSYQCGLRQIVRRLIHPHGGKCSCCDRRVWSWRKSDDFFIRTLVAADRPPLLSLLGALLDPMSIRSVVE